MSKATFIVVLTIPETTAGELSESLKELLKEVEGGLVTGILVDVTALSRNPGLLKTIGAATGPRARQEIDPELYRLGIKKIAFVSTDETYPGRDEKAPPVDKGPIVKNGAPDKHYFPNTTKALDWLRS